MIPAAKPSIEEMLARIKQRRIERDALVDNIISEHNAKYGEATPLVLVKQQPEVAKRPWYGAVIHPSTKGGAFQVTHFDLDGFSSDFSVKSIREGVDELVPQGFRLSDPNVLEDIVSTDRFVKWLTLA